jgi:hypothetical protein
MPSPCGSLNIICETVSQIKAFGTDSSA